ncbi:MAG: zinc-ribbon domain-containing protein, partial [Thermoplasmata archaeon]
MLSLQQSSLEELAQIEGIDEIDARKIRRYFDQPEELRVEERTVCPVCEIELERGATECFRCGVSLLPEMKSCPECGAEILADAEECDSCGAVLVEKEVEELPEEVKEIMQIPGVGLEKAKMLYELGYDLEKLANTPEEELLKIEGVTVPLARKISVYFEEWVEELVCPICNAPASTEATQCTQCGTIFLTGEEAEEYEGEEAPASEEAPEEVSETSPPEDAVLFEALERSHMYLVKEERSKRAFDMFQSSLKAGRKGLCVTRTYPDKVRESYDIGEATVLWLS